MCPVSGSSCGSHSLTNVGPCILIALHPRLMLSPVVCYVRPFLPDADYENTGFSGSRTRITDSAQDHRHELRPLFPCSTDCGLALM